jgi:hypothetical protein
MSACGSVQATCRRSVSRSSAARTRSIVADVDVVDDVVDDDDDDCWIGDVAIGVVDVDVADDDDDDGAVVAETASEASTPSSAATSVRDSRSGDTMRALPLLVVVVDDIVVVDATEAAASSSR